MNRENIKKVRDVIAGLRPQRFDMCQWATADDAVHLHRDCGTAACIGGWTNALLSSPAEFMDFDLAGKRLGITLGQTYKLFMPEDYDVPGHYTRAHAVRVLDHLLETGEVDWQSTRRAKKAPNSGRTALSVAPSSAKTGDRK
jgi:hypothetical protein